MAESISIRTIPNIQQLPVSAIHRLYQDSEGYMWYGTVEGLCRDDGYQIITFHSCSQSGKPNTNDPITSIQESPSGDIWFGTDNGCFILHKSGYYVTMVDHELCKNIRSEVLGTDTEDNIYVSIPGKLLKFKENGTLSQTYEVPMNATLSNFNETSDGKLWFSGWGMQLMCIDIESGLLKFIPESPEIVNHTLAKDRKNLWLGTQDGSIYFYDISENKSRLCYGPTNESILFLLQDYENGDIWATTGTGLQKYYVSENGNLIKRDIENNLFDYTLMLNEIIKSNNGNLWVSAFDIPSFFIETEPTLPRYYPLSNVNKHFNNKATVIGLAEGKNNNVWFSQERSGLCLYNLNTETLIFYKDCLQIKDLPLNSINEMTRSEDGSKVWVTPNGSLTVYQLQDCGSSINLLKSISLDEKTNGFIKKLWEDRNGILWIGTNKDLFTYNPFENRLSLVADNIGNISDIRESALNSIWISTTNNGLWKINAGSKPYQCPASDKYFITSVSPAINGDAWFSTDSGDIFHYSAKGKTISVPQFDIPMERCAINHLYADSYGHVWIIANQKVVEFNPSNGASHIYATSEEGMPWRILPTSFYVDDKENIFVGGIPGISRLIPSPRLEIEASNVKTLVSDVRVGGKSILIGDSTKINSPTEIVLDKNDINIDIYFTSLNHSYASKTRYAYKLSDFDKEWIKLEPGKNVASYTHLPPGTHTLQVRSTDTNDQWSDSVSTIKIYREPAFHETLWFRMIVIFSVIVIFVLAIYAYVRYLKKKNEEISKDSTEMIRMKAYITSTNDEDNPQYEEMNRILLRKITSVIESNLSDTNFSVDSLAKAMNMSKSTLTRKMKTSTDMTPLEYIRHIKMRHAKAMLSDKGRNISDVAFALGYDNSKYFTHNFKNTFGMTPSEYQKSSVNKEDTDNEGASFESK